MKIILFDINGVIIRPPHYFGKELETQGYKNAENILNNFFRNENTACTEGRANIEEIIVPYLQNIGWKKTVEVFFQEQFDFEAQFFDETFVSIVKDLQQKNILCYIASAQEKVRAEYFLNDFGFNELFDGHYISCDVGYRKDKPEYWEFVILDLQKKYSEVKLNEILFIDDGQNNIDMAKHFGIQTFLFTDMRDLKKYIANI